MISRTPINDVIVFLRFPLFLYQFEELVSFVLEKTPQPLFGSATRLYISLQFYSHIFHYSCVIFDVAAYLDASLRSESILIEEIMASHLRNARVSPFQLIRRTFFDPLIFTVPTVSTQSTPSVFAKMLMYREGDALFSLVIGFCGRGWTADD